MKIMKIMVAGVLLASVAGFTACKTSERIDRVGDIHGTEKPVNVSMTDASAKARTWENFGRAPLSFEANDGQVDTRVKYFSRGPGYNLYLTSSESVLVLTKTEKEEKGASLTPEAKMPKVKSSVLRMKFLDANLDPQITGTDKISSKSNYLVGRDESKWRTGVDHYAKVRYESVYPGIDLVYYGNQRQLEYDLVVAPGADPSAIRFAIEGAENMQIDDNGNLVLHTPQGDVIQHAPVVYQDSEGARKTLDGRYVLSGKNEVSFQIAAYDADKPLVIDPVLGFSTFFGGSLNDDAFGVFADKLNNIYVVGETHSVDFPLQNVLLSKGEQGVAILKFTASGVLVFSTYLGGNNSDSAKNIFADDSGNIYVAGTTYSTDFPVTPGAFQTIKDGGLDGFITKIDATGSALIFSTYLGGNSREEVTGLGVDSSGIYVSGQTNSSNFPMKDPIISGSGVFVTKLNLTGTELIYSTNVSGAHGYTFPRGKLVVDSTGSVYTAGFIAKGGLSTVNAYQSDPHGVWEGFIIKLNPTGSAISYSTYFGGNGSDQILGLALDKSDNLYAVGTTTSTNLPITADALQSRIVGSSDCLMAKFSPSGSLLYSTYLGGNAVDKCEAIAVDSKDNVYIGGLTFSNDLPQVNSLMSRSYNGDGFIAGISPHGSLFFSTYLGSDGHDYLHGLAVDSANNLIAVGETNSPGFPIKNAVQGTLKSMAINFFVTKITDLTTPATLLATPATDIAAEGEPGGPFNFVGQSQPSTISVVYTAKNTGDEALNFAYSFVGVAHDSATGNTTNSAWVTLDFVGATHDSLTGATTTTIPSGASAKLTASLSATAKDLKVALYTGKLSLTNTTNGGGNTTRDITLKVLKPGSLMASPEAGLVASGLEGGPFSPTDITYDLTNPGETDVSFTISKTQDWLTYSFVGATQGSMTATTSSASTTTTNASTGTLKPGEHVSLKVSITGGANALAAKAYTDTLSITYTSKSGRWTGTVTRPVSLTVKRLGELSIDPATDLNATGAPGGPFSPTSTSYTLRNTGESPIIYSASGSQAWIAASPASGTLSPGVSATVTVSIGAAANSLASRTYSGSVIFTNTTNNRGTTIRPVTLKVQIPGTLTVTPTAQLFITSEAGSNLFAPTGETYTLKNVGDLSLNFNVGSTLNWMTLSGKTTGALAAGETATALAQVNTVANGLTPGSFGGNIYFENTTNNLGNVSVSVTLKVTDMTPPVVKAPADVMADAQGAATPVAIGMATATDNAAVVSLINDAPAAGFPMGVTVVTWTAKDAMGNVGTATQRVTVADKTPPAFAFTQLKDTLWPPNHQMVLVATVTGLKDLVDLDPKLNIAVTSNQPVNGMGDGNTQSDWQVVKNGDTWNISVRAERTGNRQDRIYGIQVTATDKSGNVKTQSAAVTVPHSRS